MYVVKERALLCVRVLTYTADVREVKAAACNLAIVTFL